MAAPFGSGYWSSPSPDTSPVLGAGPSSGQFDQLIDPVTLDYVRTPTGEWAETADSRSTMLLMLELRLGASPFDPGDGTALADMRESGDPLVPEDALHETLRALGVLQAEGIISGLTAEVRDQDNNILLDEAGRLLVRTHCHDLAAGSPIDSIFQLG